MMIQPINVRQLLTELWAEKRMSDRKIGQAVATTGSTICRLRRGVTKTTCGDRTIAIANFHAEVFGQESKT